MVNDGKKAIDLIKEALPEIPIEKKKSAKKEVDAFLENHGIGMLILSTFDEAGNTEMKLNMVRSYKRHSKQTFQKLFEEFPQLKEDLREMFEEENQKRRNENITLKSVS